VVKLIEVCKPNNYTTLGDKTKYTLKEVFINPQHVVCLREDNLARRHLVEGRMPPGLDERQEFTKVHINRGQSGIDITVVGNPVMIEQQLNLEKQQVLLKG
tara:strand:- start:2517 stop:2819 length:303 start_codon:yes stop_codon:yes gene_type:complete